MDDVAAFFMNLFDTSGFPARWSCGSWTQFHGWLYITANLAIWGAYFTIPVLLWYFVRNRQDVPFSSILLWFAAFILACGATHFMDALIFWWPGYRLSAVLLVITAVVSWGTVMKIIPVIPKALMLRSPEELTREIQERKRAEEQVARLNRTLEKRFLSTFEQAAVGIAHISKSGVWIRLNKRYGQFLGCPSEELVGRNHKEFIHPDDVELNESLFQQLLEGKTEHYVVRMRYVRKGGDFIWVKLTVSLVYDETGELEYALAVAEDISRKKQIEEENRRWAEELEKRVEERTAQLKAVNQELEAFSYSVSHDLRAPLRAIDGFSLALLEDYENVLDETGKDYLDRVRTETQRMGGLIDDMLQLSRLTRGEMIRQDIDLSQMAHEVIDELRVGDPKRHVVVEIQDGIVVNADEYLIRAVIQNLLENAWKFTSKTMDAHIWFGMLQSHDEGGEKTVYFVKDNGAGFDMAYVNKMFTAFQRLHGVDEFPGSGIGLATVQRVIHRHGGEVWAEGEVGKGATIYFTLN